MNGLGSYKCDLALVGICKSSSDGVVGALHAGFLPRVLKCVDEGDTLYIISCT